MSATNDRQSATAMPPPRFQFNLKFLLAVMAACAVSAAVVPFDWQPFCPLAMAVLVVGSMAINLSFWGWASNRTPEIVGVVIASCLSAVIAFCTTCVPIGFFTFPPIDHIPPSMPRSLPSAWQIYLFASAWWLGGIAACVVANYVLIRRRRQAYRELHWSERAVDGRG